MFINNLNRYKYNIDTETNIIGRRIFISKEVSHENLNLRNYDDVSVKSI